MTEDKACTIDEIIGEDRIITADEWKGLSAKSRAQINLLMLRNQALTASLFHAEKQIRQLHLEIVKLEIDNDVMRTSLGNMIDVF